MDWFLYDIGLRHERIKCGIAATFISSGRIVSIPVAFLEFKPCVSFSISIPFTKWKIFFPFPWNEDESIFFIWNILGWFS